MRSIVITSIAATTLAGCTLSFQNISTHGAATDLVDENQSATANVSPQVTVPAI